MTVAKMCIEFVYTSQLTLMMLRLRNTGMPCFSPIPLKMYNCFVVIIIIIAMSI